MWKVLMVDDDAIVLADNRRYFERMGYQVVCAETVSDAEKIIGSAALDCAVLDIDLPDDNGFDLCARVREKSGIPIVFLSGYSEEYSRVKGLSVGGDDYVCKPYSMEELELRVRARIRARRVALPPNPLQYDQFLLFPGSRSVRYGNDSVDFSTYEFDLLYFLASHPGEVFTYEQLFDQVWKSPMNLGLKSLQMMIVRIRKKLMALCPKHEYIQTVRRKGYLFVP